MSKHLPKNLEGKRIRLISMSDDPCPIDAGTEGIVTRVVAPFPDSVQVSVKWDNGRTLGLVVPPDIYEVID